MPKQPAFPGLGHAMKKKRTRREKFLAKMEAVVQALIYLRHNELKFLRKGSEMKQRSVNYFLSLMLVTSFATQASASMTGNKFLELCLQDDPFSRGFCHGFVLGAADMVRQVNHFIEENPSASAFNFSRVCVPSGVTVKQISDIFIEYLRSNPEIRHYNAASSVWVAMAGAFPCE